MSRKTKKQKKRKFPLPLLILFGVGGFLLVAAMVLFTGRNRDNAAIGDSTPMLKVDQERIDYGDVKFNTPKTFTITVTNIGDKELRFTKEPYIKVLEGC
jgi:hypothetical protein